MKKQRILAIILAMLMVLSLAACGSEAAETPSTATETPAADSPASAPEEAEEAAETSSGKFIADSVTIANGDPITFSPYNSKGDGKNPLCGVYQAMCGIDGFGGELYGILAKDWHWEGNDLYVEMYDYIYDSLGNNITASDFVFSCETSAELGFFQAKYESATNGAEVVSDYEVVIHYKNPDTFQIENSLLTNQYVFSQKAWEESGDGLASYSAGTGPYVLKEFVPGAYCTLERRDDYWQTDESLINPQNAANVQTVTYKFITDSAQIMNALIAGEIDYACDVNQETVDALRYSDEFTVSPFPNYKSWALFPNCWETSPMSDINLRAAVFYAINADDIVLALGGEEIAQKTLNFGVPAFSGYNPDWDKESDSYYWVSDIDVAKGYLDQSSYNGQPLVIAYESGAYSSIGEATALVIGEALNKLGITYEVAPTDSSMFTDIYTNEEHYDEWDLLIRVGGTSGYEMSLFNLFQHSMNTNGINNMAKDENDEFQQFLAKAYTNSGNTQENLDYLVNYIEEGYYAYHLFTTNAFEVYRTSLISDVSVKNHILWILPYAFKYVEK